MNDPTQEFHLVSPAALETLARDENSVMLGCYDVWSATPENDQLCAEFYPLRESDELLENIETSF